MAISAVEIFFSFVTEDQDFLHRIREQLSTLERNRSLHCWSREDIRASEVIEDETQRHLEGAALIALLISPAYLNSPEQYRELSTAMERQRAGQARVIPILLKPGLYEDAPFAGLAALPANDRPVSSWEKRDQAYSEIAAGIRRILQQEPPTPSTVSRNEVWSVPYRRNSFFTGREAQLQAIETALGAGQSAAIVQAISGLGGIGKTQLALEYAHRHRETYRYVFWTLAETRETLNASYSQLAQLLSLPEQHEQEQRLVTEAVRRWLARHQGWLLILDNADDLALAQEFLPLTAPGHILLTTRAQAMGNLAERVEIKKLNEEEGSLFLLHRSRLLARTVALADATPQARAQAAALVRELDGLPLALDQAGAYIEETSCALQDYLELYRIERTALLRERGGPGSDHPEPVATTWKLSFERVEQANPAAADLLRLCAFLAPDDIPELILLEGAAHLTPLLQELASSRLKLLKAIAALQGYSLITSHAATHTLDIHRLVQAVLRDAMPAKEERAWAERVIRAVKQVFPWSEVANWERCRQLLPHAQSCAELIERWQMESFEGGRLLNCLGYYLHERGEYQEAETHFAKTFVIVQNIQGSEHPNTAQSLSNLANVYRVQGKLAEAEAAHQQALAIRQRVLGQEHPRTAESLGNLANVYRVQGKLAEAEAAHQQALAIFQRVLGQEHPHIAQSLNNLANVYQAQGKLAEAEAADLQALAIRQRVLGQEHPHTAESLNNLAVVYRDQGRYEEALPLFEKALAIWQERLGPEHPDTKMARRNYEETLERMKGRE